MRPTIIWMDGDIDGGELTAAARQAFEAAAPGLAEHQTARFGWNAALEGGASLPQATLERCRPAQAMFIGGAAAAPEPGDSKRSLAAGGGPTPLEALRLGLGLNVQVTEAGRQLLFELPAEPGEEELDAAFVGARGASLTLIGAKAQLRAQARARAQAHVEVQLRELEPFAAATGLLREPTGFGALACGPELGGVLAAILAHQNGGADALGTSYRNARQACFTPLAPARRAFLGAGHADPLPAFRTVHRMLEFLGLEASATRMARALEGLESGGPRPISRGGEASSAQITASLLTRL